MFIKYAYPHENVHGIHNHVHTFMFIYTIIKHSGVHTLLYTYIRVQVFLVIGRCYYL